MRTQCCVIEADEWCMLYVGDSLLKKEREKVRKKEREFIVAHEGRGALLSSGLGDVIVLLIVLQSFS